MLIRCSDFHIFPPLKFIRKTVDHDAVRDFRSSSNLGRSSFDLMSANAKYDLRVNIPGERVLAGDFSILGVPRELNIGDLLPFLCCCCC